MDGKLDIHGSVKQYKIYKRRLLQLDIAKENKDLILRYLQDLELGRSSSRPISAHRGMKVLMHLRIMARWLQKPFTQLTKEDVDKVALALRDDKYKKLQGDPYSPRTKEDFARIWSGFVKWIYPDDLKRIKDLSFNMICKPIEINAITEDQVKKLAEYSNDPKYKALIWFLFDSGARIEETLNVKPEDLTWNNEKNCYLLRIVHSKTKPRTISLPICSQSIQEYVSTRKGKRYLFDIRYNAINKYIRELSKKILDHKVTAHILRHSAATYYANILNPYQFCKRFGWSMNSKSPARYIDRAGIGEDTIIDKVVNSNLAAVQQENQRLKTQVVNLEQQQEELRKRVEAITQFFESGRGSKNNNHKQQR